MKASNISVGRIGEIISHFLKRFHVAIYSLTVVIAVSAAMFLLNNIINLSNESQTPVADTSVFESDTVDKIRNFNASDRINNTLDIPRNQRVNPFP